MRDDGDDSRSTWAAKPVHAFAVRAFVALAPLATSILASRLAAPHLWRPSGAVGLAVFIVQLAAVGITVALGTDRIVRRLLPLTTLLNLTLVFPDHAPSRFGVALRAGSIKQLRRETGNADAQTLPGDHQAAAEELLVMVTSLANHERMTLGHTERVRAYCDLIGRRLGLSEHERGLLGWSALIHDVGKLQVPAEILSLPGKPSEAQWRILAEHPQAGAAMVEPLADWLGPWRLSARDHHERWDGTGYPNGTAGEDISLAGRIVAVADAYDVITSTRSYKQPQSTEHARKELVRCSGTQFDPDVVRALLNASLTDRRVGVGMLGWLAELPSLSSITSGVGQTVATTATAATVTVGSVAVGPWAPLTTNPDQAYEIDAAALDQAETDALAFTGGQPVDETPTETEPETDPATAGDAPESPNPEQSEGPNSDGSPDNAPPSEADAGPAGAQESAGPVSTSADGNPDRPTAAPEPSTGETTATTRSGSSASTTNSVRRTTTTRAVTATTAARPATTSRPATRPTTAPSTAPTTAPPTTAAPTTAAPTTTAPPATTTTVAPTTTTTIAAPVAVFNLDSDGRTRSHWILSLDDAPNAGPLANYDKDRNADPGLTVKKGTGLSDRNNTKRQRWSVYYGDRTFTGTSTLTIWAATKDFATDKRGTFEVGVSRCHLLECDLLASRTASFEQSAFGTGFGEVTVELPPVDRYFEWYHYLVLTVAPTGASDDDLWFAYDSESFPSRLVIN